MPDLDFHRYPPTGDRDLWVRYGPAGPGSDDDGFAGRRIAEHLHTAPEAGAECTGCGFPWWPPKLEVVR